MHNAPGGGGHMTPRSRRETPQPEEIGIDIIEEKPIETILETQEKGDSEMVDEGEIGDAARQPGANGQHGVVKAEKEPEQMDTS